MLTAVSNSLSLSLSPLSRCQSSSISALHLEICPILRGPCHVSCCLPQYSAANAAVNNLQHSYMQHSISMSFTLLTFSLDHGTWYSIRTYMHVHNTLCPDPTHYFLERATYAVGKIKFRENFTPIQRAGYWRKFYPANFMSYTVIGIYNGTSYTPVVLELPMLALKLIVTLKTPDV